MNAYMEYKLLQNKNLINHIMKDNSMTVNDKLINKDNVLTLSNDELFDINKNLSNIQDMEIIHSMTREELLKDISLGFELLDKKSQKVVMQMIELLSEKQRKGV